MIVLIFRDFVQAALMQTSYFHSHSAAALFHPRNRADVLQYLMQRLDLGLQDEDNTLGVAAWKVSQTDISFGVHFKIQMFQKNTVWLKVQMFQNQIFSEKKETN